MKELERIRKIEDKYYRRLEAEKKRAELAIKNAKMERGKIISKMVKEAEKLIEKMKSDVEREAKKERAVILKKAERKVKEIEKMGKKNMENAVKFIINNI